jgi:hypothetical protein
MSSFHIGKLLFTRAQCRVEAGAPGQPLRVLAGVSMLVTGKAVDYVIA